VPAVRLSQWVTRRAGSLSPRPKSRGKQQRRASGATGEDGPFRPRRRPRPRTGSNRHVVSTHGDCPRREKDPEWPAGHSPGPIHDLRKGGTIAPGARFPGRPAHSPRACRRGGTDFPISPGKPEVCEGKPVEATQRARAQGANACKGRQFALDNPASDEALLGGLGSARRCVPLRRSEGPPGKPDVSVRR
jgi:hypothetical protein